MRALFFVTCCLLLGSGNAVALTALKTNATSASPGNINTEFGKANANFAELANGLSGKANTSAFASQSAFTSAWGWTPGGISAWSDIQALLTPGGTYVKADGTTGDPTGTITTGTGVAAAMANALDGTGGLASKASLDALPNIVFGTGITVVEDTPSSGTDTVSIDADTTPTSGSSRPLTSGGAYTALAGKEPADATIIKVADIDTQSEFEALLGWTLPTGGGAGGYVTAPVYSDSVCTAGTYSFHATYGVVYCRATNTWDYQVVSGSSLAWASWNSPTPVTYAATLTITDTSATGDTFTLNSIAYDAADSPVSVTDLPTATEQITYTGSNTAACTGDVTGTGPWTINDSPATVGCTVTASVAECNTMLFDESGASTGTTGVGANTTSYYAGIWNIGSSTVSICKIDANIQASASLTGRTIYVERWSVVGTTLTTKLEDITTVDGSTISTTTGDVSIAFGKTVSVGQNEAVVFTLNSSSSAYLRIYYTSTGSVSGWRAGSWTSTGATNNLAAGTDFLWTAYGN